MGAALATRGVIDRSPRQQARIAGVFYLLTFLTGGLALAAGGSLVVSGNAAATASNLLAHVSEFRLHFVADQLATAWYLVVTALFYGLFRPVSRTLSLLAAFSSLVGCTIGALSGVFHIAPLYVLGDANYLNVFSAQERQALALFLLKLYNQAQSIDLVFFGLYCLLIGYLIWKSTFLPRVLGVLMMLGGLGWLTFLWPPLAQALSPFNLGPGIVGEGALTLWLLAFAVNEPRWLEQAQVASLEPA
jgi:hypothetical protein